MAISIRPLIDSDLEAVDDILKLAFQTTASRLSDLQFIRQIQPDGWFVAARAETPVGLVGTVSYGEVAHVGFMAVHPQAQRQGIGLALMQFVLSGLEQKGVPLVTLDASEAGRHLYESLGFVPYDETVLLRRPGPSAAPRGNATVASLTVRDLDELVQADTQIFGADRRKLFQALLEAFPGRAFLQRDAAGQVAGYLFAQTVRIGPWVMLGAQSAEGLLRSALGLSFEEPPSLHVPSGNRAALALLQRHGFESLRYDLHMGRGVNAPPGQRRKIFAQTSLALG